MRKQVFIEQGTAEWKAWRKGKMGASDAPVILGESIYKTPLDLFYEKIDVKEYETTKAMQRGVDFEPAARKAACEILGVDYRPACFELVKNPYIIASLDGWNESNGALEIKIPNADDHALANGGIVPMHYVAQCQQIMLVTNSDSMFYVSYQPRTQDVATVLVRKDNRYCDTILLHAEEFLRRIKEYDPPPETERDYPRVYDVDKIEADFRLIQENLKIWEDKDKEIRKKALELVGHKNGYIGDLRITRTLRSGTVDYKQLADDYHVDVEKYRKEPVISYRFS